MRILFVVHDFLPRHSSGTEIYTADVALRLRERGHECAVFTAEKDVGRRHLSLVRREWRGLPVLELTNNLFYADFRETWDWPPAAQAFARALDELRPDVVHVMHLLYLSIGCVEEAARRGIPVVYTLHDFWLMCARFGQLLHADGTLCHTIDFERCGTCLAGLKFAQTGLERRTARALAGLRAATGIDLAPAARRAAEIALRAPRDPPPAPAAHDPRAERMALAMGERERAIRERLIPKVARFLAPSRFLHARFVAWGLPAERSEHLDYGLELDPFHGFARAPSDLLRVAFLGTLAPHKAPHLLLEAWGELPAELRSRARLTLYGGWHDASYHARLAALARRHGAVLAGARSREELVPTLREIDLLVVPSVWFENSPLAVHEALASGTPLVVSDLGGLAELVEPGQAGWRFRAGDAHDLARILGELLRAPARLAELAGSAVKDMRESARELEERYARAAREATGA